MTAPIIVELLKFDIKPFPREKVNITALNSEPQVTSTAKLLNDIYNGTTKLKNIEDLNIKNKLIKEIIEFQSILQEYYTEPGLTKQDKQDLKKKLKRKLSPEASFTAFKIWIIKNNDDLYQDFKNLLE